MWSEGHSFDEIDNMSMDQVAVIISYWTGKQLGEAKLRKSKKKLSGDGSGRKKR